MIDCVVCFTRTVGNSNRPEGLKLGPCAEHRDIQVRACYPHWMEWKHELGGFKCFYCGHFVADPARSAREGGTS